MKHCELCYEEIDIGYRICFSCYQELLANYNEYILEEVYKNKFEAVTEMIHTSKNTSNQIIWKLTEIKQ